MTRGIKPNSPARTEILAECLTCRPSMVRRIAFALLPIVFSVAAAPLPTHFTRDPARFKAMQQALIDKAAAQNLQAGAELKQLFAKDAERCGRP